MQVITIETEAYQGLLSMFAEACGQVKTLTEAEKKRSDKKLLSISEVAEMTGYSNDYIRKNKGEIGFTGETKCIRFKPADVDSWIEKNYIKARNKR